MSRIFNDFMLRRPDHNLHPGPGSSSAAGPSSASQFANTFDAYHTNDFTLPHSPSSNLYAHYGGASGDHWQAQGQHGHDAFNTM